MIHDRLRGQRHINSAEAASKDTQAVLEAEGLAGGTTFGAAEDLRPSKLFQVSCTSPIVWEDFLKVWEGSWESSGVDGHWGFLLSQ